MVNRRKDFAINKTQQTSERAAFDDDDDEWDGVGWVGMFVFCVPFVNMVV